MEAQIKAIQSSVIDGISITPRYRERQLAQLHEALIAKRTKITQVLTRESFLTQDEAVVQFLLTADAIKTFHASVHPKRCIEEEYLIAEGKDFKSRRTPFGCAYILPSQHDPLYSTLVAVAAAIAAGNCVVIEIQRTASELSAVLKELMVDALSPQTFAVVKEQPFNEIFRNRYCIQVDARQSENAVTTSRQIKTHVSQVAAVVDRSADIKAAARECVRARFAFGGRSAYAPDMVLVNEFSVHSFCNAAAESALQYLSGSANGKLENGSAEQFKRPTGLDSHFQKQLRSSSAEILVSGDRGTIALLKKRDNALLSTKIDAPLLLVVPVTSMDDAIDYLGKENQSLRATFLFCAPAGAKYLGQFICSTITTVNHIPSELLIGGPAPSGHPISTHPRYTTDMFSVPQPEIIQIATLSSTIETLISEDLAPKEKRKAEEAMNISLDRVKEAFGPPVGFFEQGILFGLSCLLITSVTVGLLSVKYGGPILMSKLRA